MNRPVAFTGKSFRCPECGRALVQHMGTGEVTERGQPHGTPDRPCKPEEEAR